jgi:hypothetical protein
MQVKTNNNIRLMKFININLLNKPVIINKYSNFEELKKMKCTVCGSESCEILKSKGKISKELLLKCNECGNVFQRNCRGWKTC